MTPYDRIVELARRERALVADGRIDELAALAAERDALVATLPAEAPAEAQPQLEEALRIVNETSEAIAEVLEEVRRELGALRVHRRVASSYVAAGPAASFTASA